MKLYPLLLLLAGGTILTAGDIVLKQWVASNRRLFYIVGLAIYLVGTMFLAQSFKYKNIAVASVIFVIFNVVTLTIVSWLYFKEGLTAWQLVGVGMGILSVVVLEVTSP
ncbi:MAG: SMR family transporter [Patescibacteria group bacterium]